MLVGAVLVALSAACVVLSHRVDIITLDPARVTTVKNPVKAHLKDGSTVVFRHGLVVSGGEAIGEGERHDLTLKTSTRVDRIPLDTVIGMESFRTRVNAGESFLVSALASVGTFFGVGALAVAIFGSCPTIYAEGSEAEEAELFSSSIAPLFEARDLDRLRAQPDASGMLRLEVRNEAMETHYINQLQILEVQHAAGEFVVPDAKSHPTVVHDLQPPDTIVDRDGRDQRAALIASDETFYQTDLRRIDHAAAADMDDWLDVTAPVPAGADTVAVVLRARNSLLSTVLLYEVMLGPAGAAALDWLGEDLEHISTAVELGRWHHRRAGLHISIWQDGDYQEAIRIPDSGPISWHDVAAVIRVPRGKQSIRLRLSFLADHWRIDRIGVAAVNRKPVVRTIDVAAITDADGGLDPTALASVRTPDARYLQTTPGQRFFARFETGVRDQPRTFLLASQGYYTEWIRGAWITQAKVTEPFVPSDDALLAALRKWSPQRASFEQRFLAARVPVH